MPKMVMLLDVAIGDWLTNYLDLLDKFLGEYLEKLEEEYEEGEMDEELFLYQRDYLNILRKSFIITCYSILERELVAVCKSQKKLKSFTEDINDFKGGVIDKAMKYLKRVVGIDLSTAKSWQDIKNIQLIRNCIVHSDGNSTCKNFEKIRDYIEKRKQKDITIENDKIILTTEYCRYVVNTFNEFEFDTKCRLVDSKGLEIDQSIKLS
ncbi:MAG: hypothetical protein LUQ20_08085 [Candidatus Methanoperedens sp.]|nr:hypothetical protein [Candidatus Methanoperedens sp.]